MKDALHLEQKARGGGEDISIEECSLMLPTFGNMYHCMIESIILFTRLGAPQTHYKLIFPPHLPPKIVHITQRKSTNTHSECLSGSMHASVIFMKAAQCPRHF